MSDSSDITIVVLGDSITKGDQVGVEYRFTTLVEKELSACLDRGIVIINSGVNADITPLAIRRVQGDVIDHGPDYAVIMFGVNDAGFFRPETPETPADTPRVALDDFKSYLNGMVDRISAADIRLLLATPVPMSKYYWLADWPRYVKNGLNYLVDQYADTVRDIARQRALPLIDVHREFSSRPGTEDFVPDGIHPDTRGHRLIADVYMQQLPDIIG